MNLQPNSVELQTGLNKKPTYDIKIRPDALVFANSGKVCFEKISFETGFEIEAFWLQLGPALGYGLFERMPTSPDIYLLTKLQTELTPVPYPLASLQGVLWSRRAAIEAEMSISAYRNSLNHFA